MSVSTVQNWARAGAESLRQEILHGVPAATGQCSVV